MGTQHDILRAGIAAFEERGEAGLSMRDVASRVGVTPMAVYRHYKDRQALLDAIVAEATQEWRARVAKIRPCEPRDWLLKIGEAYLAYFIEKPRLFEAAFLTASKSALRYPDDFEAGRSPAVTLQLKLLADAAQRSGSKSPLSPIEMLIIIGGLAQGLISLYRAGRIAGDERSFRSLFRRALRNCVRSFGWE
ncbi:MAG: TetR/AcrR family transcriptional regulator [Pseudorhodoplanes sp.]|nr:TetR/AcrR family transcriptional regulator [Pseudorhodoplanes sp.]